MKEREEMKIVYSKKGLLAEWGPQRSLEGVAARSSVESDQKRNTKEINFELEKLKKFKSLFS